ncbi:hypothetical protein OPV22_016354 [Ensete ventricosum]|uniref:Uncharacterized protein n=1 Tax=Ensete ventricosum TaxID=4639 RepID=A0AAV8QZK7_ENSVE|nr:hypothetical protein OPV22_016354 [Ensete ventricosum]
MKRTLRRQINQSGNSLLNKICLHSQRISRRKYSYALNLRHAFSSHISQLPVITDPEIEAAMKDLLAINWDEIPDSVINETKKAVKNH